MYGKKLDEFRVRPDLQKSKNHMENVPLIFWLIAGYFHQDVIGKDSGEALLDTGLFHIAGQKNLLKTLKQTESQKMVAKLLMQKKNEGRVGKDSG